MERSQLLCDLGTFRGQQEALQGRTECLELEKKRLNDQKRMVGIWKVITEKSKLLGELEAKVEELQIKKYKLENNVITSSCEKSD